MTISQPTAIHHVELKPMGVGTAARLGPEVVPAPSAARDGFPPDFTVRLLCAGHEVLLLRCRVVAIGLRPCAYVRLLGQPVDARQRPEVHEYHVAAELGGTEWVGLDPLSVAPPSVGICTRASAVT
jgi:hypothetical protein